MKKQERRAAAPSAPAALQAAAAHCTPALQAAAARPLCEGGGEEKKMQKEELFAFARSLAGAAVDFPFKDDFETAVFRHADTRKWFGIWLAAPRRWFAAGADGAEGTGKGNTGAEFCLNVKCPPDLVPLLLQQERGVYPAYHMNRTHWVTVRLSECADETVRQLMRLSYSLTAGKARTRAK